MYNVYIIFIIFLFRRFMILHSGERGAVLSRGPSRLRRYLPSSKNTHLPNVHDILNYHRDEPLVFFWYCIFVRPPSLYCICTTCVCYIFSSIILVIYITDDNTAATVLLVDGSANNVIIIIIGYRYVLLFII